MPKHRGPSKASQILAEAESRMSAAQFAVVDAHHALQQATAILEVHRSNYNALKASLAPKPRTPRTTKPPKKEKARTEAKTSGDRSLTPKIELRCAALMDTDTICDELEGSPIHDPKGGYAGYHPFVGLTTAPRAKRKSSANKSDGNTTVITGDAAANVLSVGVGGD